YLSSLNLGFRLDVLFGVPSTGSLPRAAHAALVLCWPQTFKDLFASAPLPLSSFLPKAGAKVLLFTIRATFFLFFLKLFYIIMIIKNLKSVIFSEKQIIQDIKPSISSPKGIF
ncbi:MAG: hypothetical protein IJK36_04085, partial [Bacteroidales bacterium]|nr:hypothetical protein [Bacteroidales bacterium]